MIIIVIYVNYYTNQTPLTNHVLISILEES